MSKLSAREILVTFGDWFERQKRVLPWRDKPTLYRVWVSEVMLQQTQVVTVVPYFEKFMNRFPTVEALAEASQEDVLLHWSGLGYYSRARNLHAGAQRIVAAGGFPKDREGWESIPGVGPYTAGAILSIALGRPEAILDGNVERVVSRLRRVGRERGDAQYKARLWRLSKALVVRGAEAGVRPSVLNQALMELGATVCSVRSPKCGECPLSPACRARSGEVIEAYPPKKKPKEWVSVEEELHCVLNGKGQVLVRLRSPGEWRAGLWDLPAEAPRAGSATRIGEVRTRHVVTRHKITRTTQVWRAGALPLPQGEFRWVALEAPEVPMGSALKKTLAEVTAILGSVSTDRPR